MVSSTFSNKTLQVLIVEDDFRVAAINEAFVEVMPDFNVLKVVKTGEETISFLEKTGALPDIILLDIYIPDVTGLELLWHIRNHYPEIHVIMVTAANETATIQEALQAGIFDYIIKPVQKERVHETFCRLKSEQESLAQQQALSQDELDSLRFGRADHQAAALKDMNELPKGIDSLTLKNITEALHKSGGEGMTASTAAESIGASRSTARRYLEYLISTGDVRVQMIYGDVGRPERRYFKGQQ
ncbi:response regulator [Salipaludibacillus aurantiacus]|uniref:Two-component system, CitB family, response regulator CitT n=1 Tax=Salipaludibacillus aurantiacus TaxID=1601833 RepID=A0A1H9UCK6_9BACI|nr:response regulator [Salipaludibacillus aurantiacus]SES07195.1 two-component system, CitB family, response regulator CitT [Salipaludibacillus aurantiacus]